LSAAIACSGSEPAALATPPNLLLVTIDTLRADRLGCYGGPADSGRFLCSLGEAGTRYEWAIATAPHTAPSIASVLTGLYPSAHGVRQTAASYLPREIATLPELLRDAGYATAAFVSNPVLERSRQLDQGFGTYDQRMPRRERNRPGFVERDARSATDAALAWAQTSAETPWFLWVHFQDPHGPYDPPDAPPAIDAPGGTVLPVLTQDESGYGGIPTYQALPGVFTREAYEQRYLDEIRFLDAQLRRLVEGLDRLGIPPSILLTADHGEAFGEDGFFFAHGHSVGLDQIRVPLIWRPSPPTRPHVVSQPVSLVDVAPTLLVAAGASAPPGWPGLPLPAEDPDEGPADDAPRFVFAEHGRRAAVVTTGMYYARDHGAFEDDDSEEYADDESDGSGGSSEAELDAPTGSDRDESEAYADGPATESSAASFPPRTARLPADGRMPAYVPADGGESPLESELVRFLVEADRKAPGATHEVVPEELRARLRALGYGN